MRQTAAAADRPAPTLLGNRPPMPVLVCVDGKIVSDCVVVVSEDDPNWWRSMSVREGGKITLRDGRRLRCR
jgi:hypothetical protein